MAVAVALAVSSPISDDITLPRMLSTPALVVIFPTSNANTLLMTVLATISASVEAPHPFSLDHLQPYQPGNTGRDVIAGRDPLKALAVGVRLF